MPTKRARHYVQRDCRYKDQEKIIYVLPLKLARGGSLLQEGIQIPFSGLDIRRSSASLSWSLSQGTILQEAGRYHRADAEQV